MLCRSDLQEDAQFKNCFCPNSLCNLMTYGISLGLRPPLQNRGGADVPSALPDSRGRTSQSSSRRQAICREPRSAVIWRPGPGQSDLRAILAREIARMSLGSHHLEGWEWAAALCPPAPKLFTHAGRVLETWYVIFPLIYFALLALALIQVAQREGLCHRGRQRKGQSFWLLQLKSFPFQRHGKTSRHSFV